MTKKFFAPCALLPEGWAQNVLIDIDNAGNIARIRCDSTADDAKYLNGTLLPGIPNVHSHAHQRAITGLTEHTGQSRDSFWTWRDKMYRFAEKLTPEHFRSIAAMLYLEMMKAGYTTVGEFHYLHHQPGGQPYDNVAEMSLQLIQAANLSGIRLTLLPVLYQYSGFFKNKPSDEQKLFVCTDEMFINIFQSLADCIPQYPGLNIGIAPHSLRAVSEESLSAVLSETRRKLPGPVHIHIAEQGKEIEDCLRRFGRRPVQRLFDQFDVDDDWCLIHATHCIDEEIDKMAASGCVVGLCPTTEANLGDGVFRATDYLAQNGRIGIGSDSQISIDPVQEMRWLEYSQRLAQHRRNVLAGGYDQSTGMGLLNRIYQGGARALSRKIGQIAVGYRADFITLDETAPTLLHRRQNRLVDSWIFASNSILVNDVIVGGEHRVIDGRHPNEEIITKAFDSSIGELTR